MFVSIGDFLTTPPIARLVWLATRRPTDTDTHRHTHTRPHVLPVLDLRSPGHRPGDPAVGQVPQVRRAGLPRARPVLGPRDRRRFVDAHPEPGCRRGDQDQGQRVRHDHRLDAVHGVERPEPHVRRVLQAHRSARADQKLHLRRRAKHRASHHLGRRLHHQGRDRAGGEVHVREGDDGVRVRHHPDARHGHRARLEREEGDERDQRRAALARRRAGQSRGGEDHGGESRGGGCGGEVFGGYRHRAPAPGYHQRPARVRDALPAGYRRRQLEGCHGDDDDDAVLRHHEGHGHARQQLHHLRALGARRRRRRRRVHPNGHHAGERREQALMNRANVRKESPATERTVSRARAPPRACKYTRQTLEARSRTFS
mmetsp:Transcript_13772/g.58874  ORF Transcript_13772/g.58874 Transcript_13772/m.58874 type:complete len:370 (-) Transcript_13772:3591-4700(-)